VAKVRERLAVNEQKSHRLLREELNLKNLNEVKGGKRSVEVLRRFTALKNLDAEVKISSAWETTRENIKMPHKENLSCYELKKHKPWFDEGCSKLLDETKQAIFHWLQDPSEMNEMI
jgi:hypothetical protein